MIGKEGGREGEKLDVKAEVGCKEGEIKERKSAKKPQEVPGSSQEYTSVYIPYIMVNTPGSQENYTPVHIPCMVNATHHMCFVLLYQLFIDAHLLEKLNGRLADSVPTVLVPWERLLLHQEDLAAEASQEVAQGCPRWACTHYDDIIVGALRLL